MAQVVINDTSLTAIGNALRGRYGTEDTYTPAEMGPAVTAVPNVYAAGDEGKVVNNGELVAQTTHAEITENGTYDITTNNSVTVNVSGGGGGGFPYADVVCTLSIEEIDFSFVTIVEEDVA